MYHKGKTVAEIGLMDKEFDALNLLRNEYFHSTTAKLAHAITENHERIRLFCWNFDRDYKPRKLREDKINLIKEFSPDIVLLQECTYDDCIRLKSNFIHSVWYGDGKDSLRGIGIFSNEWFFELHPSHSYAVPFRYVVPYLAKKDNMQFTLFHVWTKYKLYDELSRNQDGFYNLEYTANIVSAIDFYKDLLVSPVIIAGDFNSGETPTVRDDGYAEAVEKLEKLNIFNCTTLYGCDKRFEMMPTYYARHDLDEKGYVDDYCFTSINEYNTIIPSVISIGKPEKWIHYSDHVPLLIDIDYKIMER